MDYIESITSKYHDEQEATERAFEEEIKDLKEDLLMCTDEDEAREMILNFSSDYEFIISALEDEDCFKCRCCGLFSETYKKCAFDCAC